MGSDHWHTRFLAENPYSMVLRRTLGMSGALYGLIGQISEGGSIPEIILSTFLLGIGGYALGDLSGGFMHIFRPSREYKERVNKQYENLLSGLKID